mgnify:FL=1
MHPALLPAFTMEEAQILTKSAEECQLRMFSDMSDDQEMDLAEQAQIPQLNEKDAQPSSVMDQIDAFLHEVSGGA